MGRGPYRTLGEVVDACSRNNPFVRAGVDAATQFMEDDLQRRLNEYRRDGISHLPVSMVVSMLTESRNLLYRYLEREVPGREDRGDG